LAKSAYPTPASVSSDSVHFADCGCEKSSEGSGEGCRAEEEGESLLGLSSSVPLHSSLAYRSVPLFIFFTSTHHSNQIKAARKHASFENTKEEPGRIQTASILHQSLHDRNEPKQEHVQR